MAYFVRLDDSVKAYLRGVEGLSREDRVRLFAAITFDLRDDAESLVTDHLRANPPESGFVYWELRLPIGDGERKFGLAVDVSRAAAGILAVVFAEEIT